MASLGMGVELQLVIFMAAYGGKDVGKKEVKAFSQWLL